VRRRKRMRRGAAAGGLTPLLDTLFILLFALLALSDVRTSNRQERVRIELPEVEPGADPAPPAEMHITLEIDARSNVSLAGSDGRLETREDLDRALAGALERAVPEEVVVEIVADREARHGVAVEVLQHLRLRGFTHVQLVASGVDEASPLLGGGAR